MSDARLHITDSHGRRVLRLDRPPFLIGRRGTADVQIVGTDVSREHAEIVKENGGFLLRDRGSRFGTFVNGEPIRERLLRHGDRIGLGKSGAVELIFVTEASGTGILGSTTSHVQLGLVAALLDGLRALGSGGVLEEVLALVIDSAIQVTGAQRGFVMLAKRDGSLELMIARGRGRTTLSGSSFITSQKIPREVFRTGRTAMVDDLEEAEHERTCAVGIRQVRCVPLRITPMKTSANATPGSRVIGVLYLDSRERSTLAVSTQSSLEAFATQAAMAIDSARLYGESAEKQRIEQELRLAAQYQHALFPEAVFEGASVDLAASSIPCRTVGGDFFEYLELAAAAFGFALGDVAGKGPPAALLATAVQAHFEAQASVSANPAEAMTRLNAVLLRRAIEARFATMFYGVITPEGTLTYCNAGQEPPLLITRTGISRLESGGPVLGLLPAASYEFGTFDLHRGDVVVVCSDGVTEARNTTGEEFGQTRLDDAVRECHGAKPEAVLEHVMEAVRNFSEGEAQADDVTALVMRYHGGTT